MTKQNLTYWRQKLLAAKKRCKESGAISGDSAIADAVSQDLSEIGEDGIQRTTVNHWLSGKRLPNIAQFIALCRAVNLDPAEALGGVTDTNKVKQPVATYSVTRDRSIEDLVTKLHSADLPARQTAIAVALAALESQSLPNTKPKRKRA